MGYEDGTKGYRVWLVEEEKIVVSKNVIFNEQNFFKDMKKDEDINRTPEETAKSKGKKKVSFKSVLVEVEGEDSNSGGAVSKVSKETGESSGEMSTEEVEDSGSDTDEDDDSTQIEDLGSYVLARDRERRTIRPPSRFEDADLIAYALASAEDLEEEEPRNYKEAMESKDWRLWNAASDEEMDSLRKNHTWDYVERPKDHKVIGCRWIHKLKPGIPGVEKPRHKSRLVAKGYAQTEGVDYNEIFAPVVKHVSIRLLLSAVVNYDLELEQLDVKTAFLHGILKEKVFMEQPEGYIQKGKENMVCLLKKSLYGLKQSPREWNHRFHTFMIKNGYTRSEYDPCVYLKGSRVENMVYLLLYVDDMLIASREGSIIQRLKDQLSAEFEMKDLGAARRILGMDIIRDKSRHILTLSQSDYLTKVLRTFGMSECRAVSTPLGSQIKLQALTKDQEREQEEEMRKVPYSSAVGSLMYAMV